MKSFKETLLIILTVGFVIFMGIFRYVHMELTESQLFFMLVSDKWFIGMTIVAMIVFSLMRKSK